MKGVNPYGSKKAKVIVELVANPNQTNRRVAELCRCSAPFVHKVRHELKLDTRNYPLQVDADKNLFLFLYDEAVSIGGDVGPEDIARGILTDAMLDAQEGGAQ